jgi:hypothetical protein
MRTRTTLSVVVTLLGWLATSREITTELRAEDKPVAQKSPAGFPAPDGVQRLQDEADLSRTVQAYQFF